MSETVYRKRLRNSWIWMVILAIVSLAGGIFALLNPLEASIAAVFIAGWTFILFGVLKLAHSFQFEGWAGFTWSLLVGALACVVGLSLLFNPAAGLISLTTLVGVLLIVLGGVKAMYAASLRPVSGWAWALVSGLLSIVLGVLIFADFQWAATSVLGILLAVELISNGVFFGVVALGLKGFAANGGRTL
ncbi:HdeD family acid-resistance protein [Aliihoeflea sp. PC F10.4]